jgi:hypothetical protein
MSKLLRKINNFFSLILENQTSSILKKDPNEEKAKRILEEYLMQISHLKNSNDKNYEKLAIKLLNWLKNVIHMIENEIQMHENSFDLFRKKLGKELEAFSIYQNEVNF